MSIWLFLFLGMFVLSRANDNLEVSLSVSCIGPFVPLGFFGYTYSMCMCQATVLATARGDSLNWYY